MGTNYKKINQKTIGIKNKPLVSIIIPTYNEERNIDILLTSIRKQKYKKIEIIVVDQSSTDKTVEIAKRHSATILSLPKPKFYSPPGNNRNIGAKKASGSILLHLDADMKLPKVDFIDDFIGLFDNEHEAVIIHEVDIAEGFWNRCKALERSLYWNTEMEAARGVTAELFKKIKGYEKTISSGEDFYISKKFEKYTKLNSSKKVFIYHRTGNLSLKKLLLKKYNYGKTAKLFFLRTNTRNFYIPNIALTSLKIYLKNWKSLLSTPIPSIFMLLLRIFEFIATNLGIFVQDVSNFKFSLLEKSKFK